MHLMSTDKNGQNQHMFMIKVEQRQDTLKNDLIPLYTEIVFQKKIVMKEEAESEY